MRKYSFISGFVIGAIIFGSIGVAATGITAILSNNNFYFNGVKTELEAYLINGNNYVKLRDVAKALNINVEYENGVVEVNSNKPYGEEVKTKSNIIDGNAYAREDFSKSANQSIFNDVYTREAYNTFRQSIIDIDTIVAGTDETGYNSNYSYAHFVDKEFTFNQPGKTDTAMKSVAASLRGYYEFTLGTEPNIKNIYEYPGYRICMVSIREHYAPANSATNSFIKSIANMSEREKIKHIQEYISNKIVYNANDTANLNEVFTSEGVVNGTCATYSNAFIYLCQRADIPCVSVQDETHGWNEVYVDGRWWICDIGYYDVARTENMLLQATYPRTDTYPEKTNFAKELLVPGSTNN